MVRMVSAILLATSFLLTGCLDPCSCSNPKGCSLTHVSDSERVLRHVVLFSWKNQTKKEDIEKIENAFRALPGKIPQVEDFEWGTDVSVEGLAQGFTHCFLVTFKDEGARAVYLPHAEHKAFVELMKPHMEKVLVLDYWAQK